MKAERCWKSWLRWWRGERKDEKGEMKDEREKRWSGWHVDPASTSSPRPRVLPTRHWQMDLICQDHSQHAIKRTLVRFVTPCPKFGSFLQKLAVQVLTCYPSPNCGGYL
jgi:hypothetical protein